MVKGTEDHPAGGLQSSSHAVSVDGARVFFYDNCTHDLYMRVNGENGRDRRIQFLGADPEGSRLLLEKTSGGTHEALLYDTESMTTSRTLFSTEEQLQVWVSEDLEVAYVESKEQLTPEAPPVTESADENLYRYDIASGSLTFVVQGGNAAYISPDGRYVYFQSKSGVAGVPGGNEKEEERLRTEGELALGQVYRYDAVENVVQCMSCASAFDPEPKLAAVFYGISGTADEGADGSPAMRVASDNGDYVFFDTPSALVPQDVDGEVVPESGSGEHLDFDFSLSSDVYEWRKMGVGGCGHIQGCLGLITSGSGGLRNMFLGTGSVWL